jgi:hypothetical protein
MTKLRLSPRHARPANPSTPDPSTPPRPMRLLVTPRPGRPPGKPLADELPRRAGPEATGELLQFPRRDPDPPPLAA